MGARAPKQSDRQPIDVISLGAGVQSTTMVLMAAHGELTPMPRAAIFADTGAEPRAVYEHLDWLRSPNVLPFPVHVVQFGNLRADSEPWTLSTIGEAVPPAYAEVVARAALALLR